MRARRPLDFSDYLELRRARDEGRAEPGDAALLAHLEATLPVPFARAIPDLHTLADAPEAPPRDLTRDAVRAAFAFRREFASHGATRRAMRMGFDLPEGEGLKDWLDLVEAERRGAMQVRRLLREFDGKVWRMFTGERRMPAAPTEAPILIRTGET